MKIALTSIHVKDPIAAHRFYTEVLGFVSRMYMPEMNLAIVVAADEPDGTGLLLEPSDNPIGRAYMEGVYAGGMPALVLGTADVQADYERLTAKGVVFREPPTRMDWGVQAVFEDTCGNLIQITQM